MLSDDEIDAAILTDYPAAYSLLGGALTAGEFKIALRRVARTVERAAYERAAQAEPKREPLSDKMVIACARVAIARIQPDEWVATDADLIDFARAIESEHGIGGSDAE